MQGLPRNLNVVPIHDFNYGLRCRCSSEIMNLFWSNKVGWIRLKTG